jgi:peptidoglycan/xylan/chitin deacetylase (PgdA/CDA1 family)
MDLDALQLRREARRREIRRRRITAMCLLVVVVAVVAVVATALTQSSSGGSSSNSRSTALRSASTSGGVSAAGSHATTTTTTSKLHAGPPGTDPIPILMYHVIAAPPPGAPFPGLYVEPAEFTEQMQALEHAGWHAVTLDQAEAYWRQGVSLGAGKPIVLSFDNGYQSQYSRALPTLRRLGWVGVENIQLSGLPPSQGGLGTQEIRNLVAAGWELDTQGMSHASLISLDAEQLHYQIVDARQTLQQRYHVPVNWFCYPSGLYDPTVVAAVKAAGYAGSTTVVPGWAHPHEDPYRLHRLRVLGGTTGQQLLSLLEGAREAPPAPSSFTTP